MREVADQWVTKDSGRRELYESGMVRDTEDGKPRFDLLLPLDVPYGHQILTRWAELMARGAEKYDARNWEQAEGEVELSRYKSSALRHLLQWMTGAADGEDHAAAVMFNILAAETVKYKMEAQSDARTAQQARRRFLEASNPSLGHDAREASDPYGRQVRYSDLEAARQGDREDARQGNRRRTVDPGQDHPAG